MLFANTSRRVRLAAATLAASTSLFGGSASLAGVPEPDLVFYGTVAVDGVPQISGGATSLEVRQGVDVIPVSISPTAPDAFYIARIPVEASQGSQTGCSGSCLSLGTAASLWVSNPALPGGESQVALLELGARGRIVRQDVEASSIASNTDLDGDGVLDFLDNCIRLGVGPSQADGDGNGIGDSCEGLVNPGLAFETIQDLNNPADPATGLGNVPYEFEIATTEVSNADYIEFLNAVAAEDPNGLFNELMGVDPRGGIARDGSAGSYTYRVRSRMAMAPVNFVSWLDAARYTNWVENGRPTGAQNVSTTETGSFDLTVAEPETNAVVNQGATVSLPTEDEWYKSAYYDPTIGGSAYWSYPTASDLAPTIASASSVGVVSNAGPNVANYALGVDWNAQDGNVSQVGSATATSFYQIFDLGGNVEEWIANDAESGTTGQERILRGGSYASSAAQISSAAGSVLRAEVLRNPTDEAADAGFRLVPEPSFSTALFAGFLGLLVASPRFR